MRLAACTILFLTLTLSHAKPLVIGVPEYQPPFIIMTGSGEYIGFDAEIITEICRRISAKCTFKPMAFGRVFNAVSSGEADIAIGAVMITLERDEEYLFSLPYLQSYGQFIVKTNSNIQSSKDFIGKKFGLLKHSVYEASLTHQLGAKIQITVYDFQAQMLDALYSGDIDVLLLDKASADYWVANNNNIYRLLGKRIPYGYGYGILTARGNENLIAKINTALLSMQKDGTYLKIYSTYFSGGDAL